LISSHILSKIKNILSDDPNWIIEYLSQRSGGIGEESLHESNQPYDRRPNAVISMRWLQAPCGTNPLLSLPGLIFMAILIWLSGAYRRADGGAGILALRRRFSG
jgi:hypothetical protein